MAQALTANVAAKCFRTTTHRSFEFFRGEKNDEAMMIAHLANDCKPILPDQCIMR